MLAGVVAGGDVVHELAVAQGHGVQVVLLVFFLQLLEHLAFFYGRDQGAALLDHLALGAGHALLLGVDVALKPRQVWPIQLDRRRAEALPLRALQLLRAPAPRAPLVPQRGLLNRQRALRLRKLFLMNFLGTAARGEDCFKPEFEHSGVIQPTGTESLLSRSDRNGLGGGVGSLNSRRAIPAE